MILKAIEAGHIYGFGVMGSHGPPPAAPVYPAMLKTRTQQPDPLAPEKQSIADAGTLAPAAQILHPLTASGRATLEAASKRYPLLVGLIPAPE